jgi:hypothetical protein
VKRDHETEVRDLVLALARISAKAGACLEGGGKFAVQTLDAIDEIAVNAIASALPSEALRQELGLARWPARASGARPQE